MATIVLVHGAWCGGWIWRDVARALRASGHKVFAPTASGLGERLHLRTPRIDLDTHIEDMTGVLDAEELTDVILVGHSYGGFLASGIADRRPGRVTGLLYVDAFVPRDGESMLGSLRPSAAERYRRAAAEYGSGWLVPPPPLDLLAFGGSDEQRAWLERRLASHPLKCLEQPIRLSGAHEAVPVKRYLFAEGFQPSSFQTAATRVANDPGWVYHAVACGHFVMTDAPDRLVAEIEATVKAVG